MKKSVVISTVLIAMLLALTGCGATGSSTANTPAASQASTSGKTSSSSLGSQVTAEGHIVPRDSAWLSFNRSGKVAEVLVKEGDTVKAGQPLVRLGDREALDAAVKTAELQVLSAQQALDDLNRNADIITGENWQALVDAQTAAADSKQKLDQLDTQATQNNIDDAAARVQDAKTKLKDAQDEFDKYKNLDKNNATRQSTEATLESDRNTYDTAVVDYTKAMNDLEVLRANDAKAQAAEKEAQRKYDASKDGPDPDALALAKSKLSDAQAQLDAANAAVDNLELVAPYAGTVVQLEVSAGEYATINQPVLQIADLSDLYVETSDLTELKVVNIVPDMKVTITPDALPDLHLTGHVVLIRDNFIEKSGDIDYVVRVHLDKTDPRLKWGMTVSADFQP